MFNSKLKQKIVELETTNDNLQKQYDLVHGMLLQRQDDLVALQRVLAAMNQQPDYSEVINKAEICVKSQVDSRLSSFLKEGLCTSFVEHFMLSFKFNLDPETYGTPVHAFNTEEEEYEDEDEDDSWDD